MRRPDVFTLDYSHPLAQGLLLASMARMGRDESIRRYNGTLVNVPNSSWFVDQELSRQAVLFSGGGDYIDHPYKAAAADLSLGCTLASWVKYGSTSDEYFGAWGAPRLYLGKQGASDLVYGFGSGFVYNGAATLGQWQHQAIVFDGSKVTPFLGGIPGLQILASWSGTQANNFGIGICIGVGRPLRGPVADTFLYRRALSPAEIALLADRTDPMLGGLIVEERPVLYYDMGGSTVDELTAQDLVVGSPILGTPALGQVHALTATGLTVSSPVLGAPVFGQVHVLLTDGLVAGSPVLGTPTLTENLDNVDVLFADDLVVGSPSLGTPAFGQIHALTAVDLAVGSPVLGTPALDDGTAQPVVDRQTIGTVSGGTVYPIEADDEVIIRLIRKSLEVVDAQLG